MFGDPGLQAEAMGLTGGQELPGLDLKKPAEVLNLWVSEWLAPMAWAGARREGKAIRRGEAIHGHD